MAILTLPKYSFRYFLINNKSIIDPVLGVVFQISQTNYTFVIFLLLASGIGHCSVIAGGGTLTGKV